MTYTIYQKEYLEAINEAEIKTSDERNNYIHPTAIIGSGVKLGYNNYIGANCYIVGDTVIGNNNHFEAYCSVGTFPEHRAFFDKKKMKGVVIYNNNVFREFTTINSGCYKNTYLGSNIWMLRGSHVGHDCEIFDYTTLSCNVLIGGHSSVGYGVNFGLGAICHQFSVIGSGSMVGMGAIVTKKSTIEPFKTYVGNPCKYLKDNEHKRKSVTPNEYNDWIRFYNTQKLNMTLQKADIKAQSSES